MQFPEIEYRLYGGKGRGSLSASWEPIWDVRGNFELNNAQLKPIMEAITRGVLASGRAATQVSYAIKVELGLPKGTVTKSSYAINGNLDGVMLQR